MLKFRLLLYPLSLIYGTVLAIRNKIFDLGIIRPISFDVPVIGIGNLVIGGSGKTPHIAFLVDRLSQDYKVAVLSRGYGRRTKGFREVEIDSVPKDCGDEPLMLKKKFPGIPVAVCENRPLGVSELLMRHPETEVVLLDDVFQHRYIKPGYMVLLTDHSRPFYRDHVLPAGNLREFRYGHNRADLVVFTRSPEKLAESEIVHHRSRVGSGTIKVSFTGIAYGELKRVSGPEEEAANLVVVTGIARPEPLIRYLDEKYAIIKHLRYRDHHRYTETDIREMMRWLGKVAPSVLATTEKDWVKLEPYFKDLTETTVFVQEMDVKPLDDVLEHEVRSFISNFQTDDD